MIVEEIKNKIVKDESRHFRMSSNKGDVEFSVDDKTKEMCAYFWNCPQEGRRFLGELENFAMLMELKLSISNVISPALEHILRKAGYEEYYVKISDLEGDTIQCWRKKEMNKENIEKCKVCGGEIDTEYGYSTPLEEKIDPKRDWLGKLQEDGSTLYFHLGCFKLYKKEEDK